MFGRIIISLITLFALSKFLPMIGIEDGFLYWGGIGLPALAMLMYVFDIDDDA